MRPSEAESAITGRLLRLWAGPRVLINAPVARKEAGLDDRDWYSEERATFGDRVVGAREGAGLSQEELARRLGVRPRTIQAWEEDTSEPRANKLQMLAGLTGVSMRWLMTGQGEGPQAPGEEMSTEAAALLAELRQLRGEFARGAERLGRLEKRLRTSLGS